MTKPRASGGGVRKMKRKRKTGRRSADNGVDSDDSLEMNDLAVEKWSYDLEAALSKKEFERPEMRDTVAAKEFNLDFVRRTGLEKPLLLSDPPADFNFKMPEAEAFSVDDVRRLVGGDRLIEVVEVDTQSSRHMTLDDFISYYKTPEEGRTELLNVLSLEFSHSGLGDVVSAPALTREIDWVRQYWPEELQCLQPNADPHHGPFSFPKVQQYCLMSVKGCFTDFHIDFGGTSVWYHVLKGKKVFWMIEPTEQNLMMYEEWILNSSSCNSAFFGDIVEKCLRVELNPGNTFLIPSGWIHGVYTPEDSIVFGGNFLHSFSIPTQLRILRCEEKIKVTKKYRYPFHSELLWYVVDGIVKKATGRSFSLPVDVSKARESGLDKLIEEGNASAVDQEQRGCVAKTLSADVQEMDSESGSAVESKTNEQSESAAANETENDKVQDEGKPKAEVENPPVHFDEEFIATMTEAEYDGFKSLLAYLRKKLSTKQRLEVLRKIEDPELLLDLFEELLKHKEKVRERSARLCENGEKSTNSVRGDASVKKEEVSSVVMDVVDGDNEMMDSETVGKDLPEAVILSNVNGKAEVDSEEIDVENIDEDENATVATEAVASPSKRPKRSAAIKAKAAMKPRAAPKRKPPPKEKTSKTPKSKSRKVDGTGVHPDRPLIVGGLPPAIMPADAPQAPNPYRYDPMAAVTALGHKQLPSAYRRTPGMAQAPPTQKFRLHPVNRTASASEDGKNVPPSSDTADKTQRPSDSALSSPDQLVTSDSVQAEPAGSTEVVRSSDISPVGRVKENLHTATRSGGRERKSTSEHGKTATVDFEYKSPLAHTYAHTSPSTSAAAFSKMKTTTKTIKKAPEKSGSSQESSAVRRFNEDSRTYRRLRSDQEGPSRRLTSEELWDSRFPREGHSRYPVSSKRSADESKFRRPSFDDRRTNERFRKFSHDAPPYREQVNPRGEDSTYRDSRRFSYEEDRRHSGLQQSPFTAHHPAFDAWRVPPPPGFNPSIPPPPRPIVPAQAQLQPTIPIEHSAFINTTLAEGVSLRSNTWTGQTMSSSEVMPEPFLPSTLANQPSCSTGYEESNVSSSRNELDSVVDAENNVQSAQSLAESIAEVVASNGLTKDPSTTDTADGNAAHQEGYRPTPLCDLPPRPDSILGIPPIIFEHDLTVTGILKRSRNAQSLGPSPVSSQDSPRDASQRVISGFGGTSIVSSTGKPKPEEETVVVEPAKPLAAGEAKKEPLDYMSTANELARLTSEITEESSTQTSITHEARLKKSESSTVLSDPRRAKSAVVNRGQDRPDSSAEQTVESAQPVEKKMDAAPDTLFDDLSSLIAEYDEIDE